MDLLLLSVRCTPRPPPDSVAACHRIRLEEQLLRAAGELALPAEVARLHARFPRLPLFYRCPCFLFFSFPTAGSRRGRSAGPAERRSHASTLSVVPLLSFPLLLFAVSFLSFSLLPSRSPLLFPSSLFRAFFSSPGPKMAPEPPLGPQDPPPKKS